jgi:hypothetical protein
MQFLLRLRALLYVYYYLFENWLDYIEKETLLSNNNTTLQLEMGSMCSFGKE